MQVELAERPLYKNELAVFAAGIALAGVLGVMAAREGMLAIALVAAPIGAFFIFTRPILGVLAVVFTIPLQNVVVFGGSATATKLLGMYVFGVWMLRKLYYRESWRALFAFNYSKVALAFVGFAFISIRWAVFPGDAYIPLFQLVQLLLLSWLIIDLADSWDDVDWLAKVLVIGATVAALLTIQEFFVTSVRRAGESVAGVNSTAAMLVTVVPFAFYLLRTQQRQIWKALSLLYILLAFVGVAVTFSRMSFIMLPLIILVHYWEAVRGRIKLRWLFVLTLIIFLAFVLIPQDLVQERIGTIVPELQAIFTGGDQVNDRGERGVHLIAGVDMFQDNPLLGVGIGNYGAHFLYDYQFRLSDAHKVWTTKRSPHSSHIGLLAELGSIGIVLWVGLLAAAARNLVTAQSRLSHERRSEQFFLVQAIMYSFLLQVLAYGWYANIHQEKLMWMLLAMSIVVRRVVEQPASESKTERSRPEPNAATTLTP